MRDDYDDFASIRNQVEKRVKKRRQVISDLRIMTLINAALWFSMIAITTLEVDDRIVGGITPLLVIFIAMSGVLEIYVIWKWFTVTYVEPRRERRLQDEVEQEFERELAKRALTEKRKNLALSDDGELVEITEDDGGLQQRGNEIYR